MHFREIHLSGFMLHEDTHIELPERGVVTVEGANGHGKTAAFVESTCVALWGKTLRKTPPWMDDKGIVRVVTDAHDATCFKKPEQSQKLSWHRVGETLPGHGSSTKGRKDLAAEIPDFETWYRTHVLTLAEGDGFLSGSDSKRKDLFESLCGLQVFDEGLKKCKEDLKASNTAALQFEGQLGALREKIKGLESGIADLNEAKTLESRVAAAPVAAKKRDAAKSLLVDARQLEADLNGELQAAVSARAQAEAEAAEATRRADRLDREKCPTCAQPIPRTLIEQLRAIADAAAQKSKAACAGAVKATRELKDRIAASRDEAAEMQRILDRAATADRDAAQVRLNEEGRQKKLALRVAELADARGKLAKAEEKLAIFRADVAELEVVERLLGVKGIRVALMNQAMSGVSALANKWLSRLWPGVNLRLYAENAEFKAAVKGVRHEHGYAGCSRGQKRRLDIACVFAAAEYRAATSGIRTGTLFLDEVADSLDEEGFAAFAEAIEEVAKDRCVVLITNNQAVLQGVRAVRRFRVDSGVVTVT